MNEKKISLSVGICTKDRRDKFFTCLESLASQKKYIDEIIVIEDIDKKSKPYCSYTFLRRKFKKSTIFYKQVDYSNISKSRNEILKACNSDILLFIDDDVVVGEKSLKNVKMTFEKNKNIDILTGKLLPVKYNSISIVDALYFNQERWNAKGLIEIGSCPFSFIALLKSNKKLDKIFFDEKLLIGEDIDFTIKSIKNHNTINFCETIINYHYYDENLVDFLKKKLHHGKFMSLLEKKHPEYYMSIYRCNFFLWPSIFYYSLKWYKKIYPAVTITSTLVILLGEFTSLIGYLKEALIYKE